MSKKIIILDYGIGNLQSVAQVFAHLNNPALISSNYKEIMSADALVLPGVGAFGHAMNNLKELYLDKSILEFVQTGKPLMGICLGFQLLFSESEEFGNHKGLDIIKGKVHKFTNDNVLNLGIKIPQVGWNKIYRSLTAVDNWAKSPLREIQNMDYMYFIHSYYAKPEVTNEILTLTQYEGTEYCSSILKDNIFAVQFHPEKSAWQGIRIYKNWIGTI
ncbi:imidazole glycerol phosphate synthase subunit HisH [Silvanigrella aquatica]|uniref:Imidazole glycerol phosphate synthase subunit HisH n=1 Tax=Silvanigrella aquatica TaxID=1915309 RepID=A0A1L4D2Y0_9BACT|nr:imidazole glycerol phosphate synthase subunit HisH [Silvanigrella aquatica]APJ04565.1 imidazole glycerol phosphate synthase, glutamine amidotransferase subunit [Silvanigrella aquatica]